MFLLFSGYDGCIKSLFLQGKIKKPYLLKYKFNVNDIVTISKMRTTFHRGWFENFTDELFTIIKRENKQDLALYTLKDMNNVVLVGSFQDEELQIYIF